MSGYFETSKTYSSIKATAIRREIHYTAVPLGNGVKRVFCRTEDDAVRLKLSIP
jgi:hypothetical protein